MPYLIKNVRDVREGKNCSYTITTSNIRQLRECVRGKSNFSVLSKYYFILLDAVKDNLYPWRINYLLHSYISYKLDY